MKPEPTRHPIGHRLGQILGAKKPRQRAIADPEPHGQLRPGHAKEPPPPAQLPLERPRRQAHEGTHRCLLLLFRSGRRAAPDRLTQCRLDHAGITSLRSAWRSSGWRCPAFQPLSAGVRGIRRRRLASMCWQPLARSAGAGGRFEKQSSVGVVRRAGSSSGSDMQVASRWRGSGRHRSSPSARARLCEVPGCGTHQVPDPASGIDPQPRPPSRLRVSPRPEGLPSRDARSAPQAAVAAPKAADAPSSADIHRRRSQAGHRPTTKGHPRARTLTPEPGLSASEKRPESVSRPMTSGNAA